MERFQNIILVRYEDVAKSPKEFINAIKQQYCLASSHRFYEVESERGLDGSKKYKPHVYPAISSKDSEFIWSELDKATEHILGYKAVKT